VTELVQSCGHVLQVLCDARVVIATTRHQEVEAQFRRLVDEAELPAPDEVEYEPASVVFYWHAPQVAVIVDFDEAQAKC
jgi:hypothetical protein